MCPTIRNKLENIGSPCHSLHFHVFRGIGSALKYCLQESDDRTPIQNSKKTSWFVHWFVHCSRFFPLPIFFLLSIMASTFKLFRLLGTGPVKLLEGKSGTCAAEAAAPDQSGSIEAEAPESS